MTLDLSTIAQLLYANERALDFARIVSELETVLGRLRGDTVEITWDCDDLVFFDMPETRILLAWTELKTTGLEGCLTVSVGPGPQSAPHVTDSEHDVLCSRLVERIQNRFLPMSIIWRQVEGAIGSELIDDLIDTLPDMRTVVPAADSVLDEVSKSARATSTRRSAPSMLHPDDALVELQKIARLKARPNAAPARRTASGKVVRASFKARAKAEPSAPVVAAANDHPDLPLPLDTELTRLRTALYPEQPATAQAGGGDGARYSTQMRLAAHCFNATLILVWSPLGAAVMTYSILKGEDMRLSARIMAVAGTLFALAHSPIGDTVAAIAGVA